MLRLCLLLLLLVPVQLQAADPDELVTVTPEETDEILANSGIGWETFHRTSKADKNLPPWIPSTIRYDRWGWKVLEPEQGKIDYEFIDGVLKETHEAGQQLAFRVMCCSPYPRRMYHPEWLRDIGGKIVKTKHGDRSEVEVPVLDDPKILAAHLDFIKRLGARYDGHPDITRLDLGSVGWWGEWHMSRSSNAKMPTLETQKKIVDAYLTAFKKTPLVMLIGGNEMLRHAVKNGTGWRADSLGDLGSFSPTWNHMFGSYPKRIQAIQDLNAWKNGPIAFEPPAAVAEFVEKDWPLRWIFNYGLAVHGSSFSGKSGRLPDDEHFREELERFLRRLGYRLVLKELRHPSNSQPGTKIGLAMKWQNVGSAPCYKPYRVAYRLSNDQGYAKVFVGTATVDKWLPGSIELFTEEFFKEPKDLPLGKVYEIADTVSLPKDIPAGQYALSVGVVGVETTQPVVQLAVKSRSDDGWYPVSKIQVKEAKTVSQTKKPAPDFSGLKKGMKLSHARAILGADGRLRENPSPEEAIYDFDFEGRSVLLIVNSEAVVTEVIISNHGKSVEEIQAERRKKWMEWVEAHSQKRQSAGEDDGDAAEWANLFNGKNLNGWVIKCLPKDNDKRDYWKVVDGSITAETPPGSKHNYIWLMTEKEYGDFELRMEVQTYSKTTGNSGIQVRSRYDDEAGWLDGPQVDINPPGPWRCGFIYDETREAKVWLWPDVGRPANAKPDHAPNGWKWFHADEQDVWNDVRIVCDGTRIKTVLNGVTVADYDGAGRLDDDAHRRHKVGLKGHIGLQIHPGKQLLIRFKDLMIRALK